MEYRDIERDYLDRVLAIYEHGQKARVLADYEVTFFLLILQALFIMCREKTRDRADLSGLHKIITSAIRDTSAKQGLEAHLRNSLAHHHFAFHNADGNIQAVIFHDREKIPLDLPVTAVPQLIRDLHAYLLGMLAATGAQKKGSSARATRSLAKKPRRRE